MGDTSRVEQRTHKSNEREGFCLVKLPIKSAQ